MSGNELKIIIENGCIEKGYSQRDLSKKIGVSHSTLNDIVNAKIKKIEERKNKSIPRKKNFGQFSIFVERERVSPPKRDFARLRWAYGRIPV